MSLRKVNRGAEGIGGAGGGGGRKGIPGRRNSMSKGVEHESVSCVWGTWE